MKTRRLTARSLSGVNMASKSAGTVSKVRRCSTDELPALTCSNHVRRVLSQPCPKETNLGRACQTGQHHEIHHHWCSHTLLDRLAHAAWASWEFRQQRTLWISLKVATRRRASPCGPSSKEPQRGPQPPVRKEWGQAWEQAAGNPKRKKNAEWGNTRTTRKRIVPEPFGFWGIMRKLKFHLLSCNQTIKFKLGFAAAPLAALLAADAHKHTVFTDPSMCL